MMEPGGSSSQEVNTEITEGKYFAVIGYFSFLCFVPLVFKKDNKYAVFHGKQALVLFILELASCVIGVIPYLGEVVSKFGFVVFAILSIIGIVKSLMDEYWEMPVVADIASKIKL